MVIDGACQKGKIKSPCVNCINSGAEKRVMKKIKKLLPLYIGK